VNVADLIKRHEGYRDRAYLDTLGVATIGWGHTAPDVCEGMTCTGEQAEAWLRRDIQNAVVDAAVALGSQYFYGLDEVRRAALTDAAFNLGRARLAGFTHMLEAIRRGDFDRAAREALASRWAAQVGVRAQEVAGMLRDGRWPA
jgi:lysozyme